jgi:hypothetical protein
MASASKHLVVINYILFINSKFKKALPPLRIQISSYIRWMMHCPLAWLPFNVDGDAPASK